MATDKHTCGGLVTNEIGVSENRPITKILNADQGRHCELSRQRKRQHVFLVNFLQLYYFLMFMFESIGGMLSPNCGKMLHTRCSQQGAQWS